MGGGASRWRITVKKIGFPCVSFSEERLSSPQTKTIPSPETSTHKERNVEELEPKEAVASKSLCAICLEPLAFDDDDDDDDDDGSSGGRAIFTAQCMHTFHVACIASNVRHGSVTCPICRAHWSQLPRDSSSISAASTSAHEPVLRILDHSIATSRVNHLSFLRSASRYDDDDPVEPHAIHHPDSHPRLRLSFLPDHLCPHLRMPAHHRYHLAAGSPPVVLPRQNASTNAQRRRRKAFLSVNLSPQPPTDLVLVASPNGPHLRLLKQSMALVVFWLRRVDRLAIVTYSTTATRAFPLRRVTAQGKRAALQIIDRLFYLGEAEPTEGLRKAVKVLEDRRHHNPLSCILHLSDHPTTTRTSYVCRELPFPIPVHRFHIGFGFGMTDGFVIHELEELLARLVGGGVIREAQLRIGEDGRLVRLGELRSGEERRIPLELIGDCDCSGFITVGYSYVEGGGAEEEEEGRLRTGEIVVDSREKRNSSSDDGHGLGGSDMRGRSCSYCVQERWDYLDPLMARRWAKHLHGHKA